MALARHNIVSVAKYRGVNSLVFGKGSKLVESVDAAGDKIGGLLLLALLLAGAALLISGAAFATVARRS